MGLSFLDRELGPGFDLRVVTVAPGASRPYVAAEWEDRIIVVERGAIEVECALGGRRCFATGAVIFTNGLDLRTIHNTGTDPAVISAVGRRSDEFAARPSSEEHDRSADP